jgi:hypothetical protein
MFAINLLIILVVTYLPCSRNRYKVVEKKKFLCGAFF